MENHMAPLIIPLYEKAEWNPKIIEMFRKHVGLAGLMTQGYGGSAVICVDLFTLREPVNWKHIFPIIFMMDGRISELSPPYSSMWTFIAGVREPSTKRTLPSLPFIGSCFLEDLVA
eukprot:GHVT01040069.1.p1 GENE.GHVT01040069.1~~GHVT01040069.1.p1  ORF type:complete len:116 (-),score=1.60 GHVT01040069.1:37-384(-)